MNLTELTISRAHQGLIKKDFSAKDLTLAFLEKIKKEDNKINSFLEVSEQLALNQAQEVDKSIAQGKDLSILAGIPCAIKDNILVQDIRCSAASKILENYIAPYDATVVKKLKQQGAIILGKTNLDEFAMGSSTENSAFGPTHNPHDLARVPGGSSGGSAAAVAANMAVYALGSDTGGSIRQPASFCGVVGLKPTYGAVSRYGLMAFASSLDQIGTITKTVEDAKIVFDAIKGHDEMDSTSVEISKKEEFNLNVKKLRIGLPKEYFIQGLDEKIKKIIENVANFYHNLGAEIIEVSLPHTEYALPCYYIIAPSEASANLARYDGIKYGKATSEKEDILHTDLINYYFKVRGEGF
jgi:aspartyl-tRNA(Asn)/glutamyl-tRNA(Gln) amidotransferase subunit A